MRVERTPGGAHGIVDIATWLGDLGFGQYAAAFSDNDVTAEVLPHLTAEDLRDLGVGSVGHRRKLLTAIAALREAEAGPPTVAAELEARPAVHAAERRQLTILFCDLVGSTALAATLDPEDMREVIRAYQDCCAGVIARFDGHVARFMGDGVLAYFGYPVAHEDDAERAVRAALDLVAAVGKLSSRQGVFLQLRVGIATGMVVVGDLVGHGAAQEQAVVGETPALAARLQSEAAPDQVLISARTQLLIGGLFECADAGRLVLKGFAKPVQAWRVVGESATGDRFAARHAASLTDLVGREREIELLLDRWALACNGEGQAALLSGEPGIGKSRIAQALRERIAGTPHVRMHHSCSPHHTNSALFPIVGRLEHAAGFNRDDTVAAKVAKLERLVGCGEGDGPEATPVFAALLGLLPEDQLAALGLGAEQQKAKTFQALVAQLETIARTQPVLMIFEDVQWIDPTTSELLGLVIDRIQTLPVLLIVTHRPDFTPPWTGHAHVTTLSLNRLSHAQRVAMIERVTGGKTLPAEVLNQIIEKTDGIPLFIEELTKTVLESGVLAEENGGYVLHGPLPPLAIPATLHDSLMARLDRLSPVKDVAQMAAAIGREFSYELLAAIVPMVEAELQKALTLLVAANIIFGRGTPPNAVYSFKHALVQDVAYEAALRRTRQQLHGRIAATLEEKFPETAAGRPELVAHHYTNAGLAAKAVEFWCRAGRLAAARSANIEARNQLEKGLELLDAIADPDERQQRELDLLVALGPPLIALEGFAAEQTVQVYRRVRELGERLGNLPAIFPALYGEWLYHAARAEHGAAQAIAVRFAALAERNQTRGLRVIAHRIAGVSHLCLGQLDDSRRHLEALLQRYTREAHRELAYRYGTDPAVSALSFLSWVYWLQGLDERAVESRTRAIVLARELGHSHSLAHALGFGCLLDCMRGDAANAQALADAVMALGRAHRFPYWLAAGTAAQGWCLMQRGDHAAAVDVLLDAIEQARGAAMEEFRPLFLAMLAEAHGAAGHPERGLAALDEAVARVDRSEERWIEPELHRLRGMLLLRASNDSAQARTCFDEAVSLSRRRGATAWERRAAKSRDDLATQRPSESELAGSGDPAYAKPA
jgi:class 3 adenylate cyclase/predicted ATPase